MKKTHTWAVVAVAAIVIIGGYFFITSDAGDTWWEQEWNPSDAEIIGKWIIEPVIVTTSGERIPMKTRSNQGLWVQHDGVAVSSVDYVLKAVADVGTSIGAYENVELDLTGLISNLRTSPVGAPDSCLDLWKTGFGNPILAVGTGGVTGTLTVATYSVPVDITDCLYCNGGTNPYCGTWQTLADMTSPWSEGVWDWELLYAGVAQYRGLSSAEGDGDWKTATLPGKIDTVVTIGEYDVSIDFSSHVTWIPG